MVNNTLWLLKHAFRYLLVLASSEERVTEVKKETAVDDSGNVTSNALLE